MRFSWLPLTPQVDSQRPATLFSPDLLHLQFIRNTLRPHTFLYLSLTPFRISELCPLYSWDVGTYASRQPDENLLRRPLEEQ